MFHSPLKVENRALMAKVMGSASVCAWVISGAYLPYSEIEAGLSLLQRDVSGFLNKEDIDNFFIAGKDTLAVLGEQILGKMAAIGDSVPESLSESLAEMRDHLAGRRDAVHEWAGDSLNGLSDRLFRISACTAQNPNDLPVIDAGKGFMSALHDVVKAWTVYKVARKVLNLVSDELTRRREDRTAEQGVSDNPSVEPDMAKPSSVDLAKSEITQSDQGHLKNTGSRKTESMTP